MQTRAARADRPAVDLRRLVSGFLRMAPDVAIVGEVRDREALPLLLTLSSGVKGFTTIHAGSARQALTRLERRIDQVQERLQRRIAIENPSHYLHLPGHEWEEADFLNTLARRSGCGLLLDVNNVCVSAHNLGFDPWPLLCAFDPDAVLEIHLAGHQADPLIGEALWVDAHATPVSESELTNPPSSDEEKVNRLLWAPSVSSSPEQVCPATLSRACIVSDRSKLARSSNAASDRSPRSQPSQTGWTLDWVRSCL